jgi:hypothetical protein
MTITIKTNNHVRELIAYADLSPAIAAEFDYLADDTEDHYTPRFFAYRGAWHDTHEFERNTNAMFDGWHAVQTESYFSAVLIRYPDTVDGVHTDWDSVVVAYSHW